MPQKHDARTRTVHSSLTANMLLTIILAVVIGFLTSSDSARDKTGTTWRCQEHGGSQVRSISPLASLRSFEAERSGFEPEMPVSRHTGLAIRRFSATQPSLRRPHCASLTGSSAVPRRNSRQGSATVLCAAKLLCPSLADRSAWATII